MDHDLNSAVFRPQYQDSFVSSWVFSLAKSKGVFLWLRQIFEIRCDAFLSQVIGSDQAWTKSYRLWHLVNNLCSLDPNRVTSTLVLFPWEELLQKSAKKSSPVLLQRINSYFIPIAHTSRVRVLCQKRGSVVMVESISSAWNLSLLKFFCKPNVKLLPSWLHQAQTPTQLSSTALKLASRIPIKIN